jgi:hypothetical protein
MPLLLKLLLALSAVMPERPVLAIKLLSQAVIIADAMVMVMQRINNAGSPNKVCIVRSITSMQRDVAEPTIFEAAAANSRHLRARLSLQMRSDLVSAALDSTRAIRIGEGLAELGIEGWEAHVQEFKALSDRIATISPAWTETRRVVSGARAAKRAQDTRAAFKGARLTGISRLV